MAPSPHEYLLLTHYNLNIFLSKRVILPRKLHQIHFQLEPIIKRLFYSWRALHSHYRLPLSPMQVLLAKISSTTDRLNLLFLGAVNRWTVVTRNFLQKWTHWCAERLLCILRHKHGKCTVQSRPSSLL